MADLKKMKAVVFDMDGLMFDTEAISVKAWDYAGEKLGLGKTGYMALKLMGANEELKEEIIREELGAHYKLKDFREHLDVFRERYYQMHDLPVKRGLYRLLHYLRKENYKLAVASATSRQGVEKNLERAGISDCFDAVVCGDMVKKSKPEPDIYQKACGMVGEKPQHCYALEDSKYGLYAAHRAGCRVFMIPDLWEPDNEVKKFVDGIFPNLDEFRIYLEQTRKVKGGKLM